MEFASIHAHRFVRVAAATPRASVGDTAHNAAETIRLARDAHAAGVDLVVFPELSLTSYALDDLHLQAAQQDATAAALAEVVAASATLDPVLLVGAALPRAGRLYNCAVAIARGRVLGVVPKSFLPNYREFYEKRWFASGAGLAGLTIAIGSDAVPFGIDLVFAAATLPAFTFHAEICEDLWSPVPPSTTGALAGAVICCNLSASNIVVGKARVRAALCSAQSMRTMAAYVYAAAGPGESTTDLAWDGQGLVYELGEELAASPRFAAHGTLTIADVDAGRLLLERQRTGTFNDAAALAAHPETRVRRIAFDHRVHRSDTGLRRDVARFPFVPDDRVRRDEDCYEAFNIQVEGVARRLDAARARTAVIGVSGGLDSTHALIVLARAMDRLGRPRSDILGYSLPGFATGAATRAQAHDLMAALSVTAGEIDIRPAATRMLADIGHPVADGEAVYDVTFENVQAGLRTDYLFRLAGRHGGLVIGTGDLSELALGWCTYGVGDQMSHYAVNTGVPKTLIQFLIRWCIASRQFDAATDAVLARILDTEISPELVPADTAGAIQSTEAAIGPYALNDFFAHHVLRRGTPPATIAFLAWHAWRDAAAGGWPDAHPAAARVAYDLPTIRHRLERFLHRFFVTSQFKRSALPNGPKVSGGGAVSPRGDWRAPADGTAAPWLADLARIPAGRVDSD